MDQYYIESGYYDSGYFVYVADAASAPSSAFTISATAGRIQSTTVNWSGVFATTMTVNVVKNGGVAVTATFTQSATPVANRSISLTLANIANLASQADKLHSTASSSMAVAFAFTADAADVIQAEATFPAVTATVLTSKYFGDFRYSSGRPRNFSGGTYDSSVKKFGTHSLAGFVQDTFSSLTPSWSYDFVFEFWDKDIRDGCEIDLGFIYITPFSSTDRRHVFRLRNSGGGTMFQSTSPTPSIGAFDHWAIVKTGNRISYYLNGTRWYTNDIGAQTLQASSTLLIGIGGTLSGGSPNRIDEVSLWIGDTLGYNANNSSLTVPTAARDNTYSYTQALWHFDGNGTDDTRLIERVTASFTNTATQTASALINRSAVAQLASTATASITALALKEANAGLSTTANFSVDGVKLVQADSALASAFAQTAEGLRTRPFDSSLTAVFDDITVIGVTRVSSSSQLVAFESNIAINANRVGETQLATVVTMSVAAEKTAGLFSDLQSQFAQTADGVRTRPFDSTQSSAFTQTTVGSRLIEAASDLTSAFTQSTDADKFRPFSIDLSVSASQTTVVVKTVDVLSSQNSAFAQSTDADRQADGQAQLSIQAAQTTAILRTRSFDAGIAATTDTAITAVKTAVGESTQSSVFAQSTVAVKTVDVSVIEDAIATQITVVARNATGTILLESTFGLSATPSRIRYLDGVETLGTTGLQIYSGSQATLGPQGSGIFTEDLQLPLSSETQATNTNWVISFWARRNLNDNSGIQFILGNESGSGAIAFDKITDPITYDETVGLLWIFPTGGGGANWDTELVFDNQWHHFLIRTNNNTQQPPQSWWDLWVDGVYKSQSRNNLITASPNISGEYLWLGDAPYTYDANPKPYKNFDGSLAQIWIGATKKTGYTFDITDFYDDGFQDLGVNGTSNGSIPSPSIYNLLTDPFVNVNLEDYGSNVKTAPEGLYYDSLRGVFTFSALPAVRIVSTASLSSTVSQTTLISYTADQEADLSLAFTQSTTAESRIGVIAALTATATQTTAVNVIRGADLSITVTATVFAEVGDLDSAQATLSSAFELTADAVLIEPTRASALLQADTQLTADAESLFNNGADLSAAFTVTADVTVIPPVRVEADLSVTVTLSATIGSIEQFAVLVMSAGTMTTQARALKDAFVPLTARFTETATAERRFRNTGANLSVTGFQLTAGDIINIDPALTLVIKPERRALVILEETRVYQVQSETRTLIITKG